MKYYISFNRPADKISFEIDGLGFFFDELKKDKLLNSVVLNINLESIQLKLTDLTLRIKFFTKISISFWL